jgi:hypothetical protein
LAIRTHIPFDYWAEADDRVVYTTLELIAEMDNPKGR